MSTPPTPEQEKRFAEADIGLGPMQPLTPEEKEHQWSANQDAGCIGGSATCMKCGCDSDDAVANQPCLGSEEALMRFYINKNVERIKANADIGVGPMREEAGVVCPKCGSRNLSKWPQFTNRWRCLNCNEDPIWINPAPAAAVESDGIADELKRLEGKHGQEIGCRVNALRNYLEEIIRLRARIIELEKELADEKGRRIYYQQIAARGYTDAQQI